MPVVCECSLIIGVEHVYAKALSEAHSRILQKIGASEVFFPEKDQTISLAERLHNPNMLDYLPFLEGYSITKRSVNIVNSFPYVCVVMVVILLLTPMDGFLS